jgi:hypothetical protein
MPEAAMTSRLRGVGAPALLPPFSGPFTHSRVGPLVTFRIALPPIGLGSTTFLSRDITTS